MYSLTGYSNFNTEKSSLCRYEIAFVNVNILCTLVSYLFTGDINYALKQQVSVLIDIVYCKFELFVCFQFTLGFSNPWSANWPCIERTPFREESVDEMLIK